MYSAITPPAAGDDTLSGIHGIEKLWAKELYELSFQDREIINDELHGASFSSVYGIQEDGLLEKNFSAYLQIFQQEIETKIGHENKQSYIRALRLKSSFVMTPEFRLGFLRADQYDVEKAAARYCRCLNFLEEFFGIQALLRPLRLTDLTKNEMKFLREGFVQILPSRDSLGRRILVLLGSYGGKRYTVIEKFRVCSYLVFATLTEDLTTQRLGMVVIGSLTHEAVGWMKESIRLVTSNMERFFAAVPLRWSACHCCVSEGRLSHLLRRLVLFTIGREGRKIIRIHVGTPMECDYELRSFGIPTEDIPRTNTHKIKLKNHTRHLKVRKSIDRFREFSMNSKVAHTLLFSQIECPEINCVIFGKNAWEHPGNIEFREIIQKLVTEQEEVRDGDQDIVEERVRDGDQDIVEERRSLTKMVIEECSCRKARFLLYDRETFFYKEIKEYDEISKFVTQSIKQYDKRRKAKRMIDGTKIAMEQIHGNQNKSGDITNTSSVLGHQNYEGSKFMKDCDGCKCLTSS